MSKGQVKIESKDDMRKRGLPSPDHADGLVMTLVEDSQGIVVAEDDDHDPTPTLTGDLLHAG